MSLWHKLAIAAAVLFIVQHLARWYVHEDTTARVWRPSAAGFEYPEMRAGTLRDYLLTKDNFGIALAGGGARGQGFAQGAVRVLRSSGVLERARYLTISSGSAWMGIPMYYQTRDSLDAFLGESMAPEELSPEALTGKRAGTMITRLTSFYSRYPKGKKKKPSADEWSEDQESMEVENRKAAESEWGLPEGVISSIFNCFRDPCSCVVERAIPLKNPQELWSILAAYITLRPFGLARPGSLYTHETELERITAKLGKQHTIYAAKDISRRLPFLISQAAVLAPYSGRGSEPLVAFPLEHTALYRGITPAFTGASAEPYKALGDVLIEPFAWPGDAREPVPQKPMAEIKITRRPEFFNLGLLAEWAGVETSYIADFMADESVANYSDCKITLIEKIMPHMQMWSPLDVDKHGVPIDRHVAVGDAGVYDDLGHLMLLRRRVTKIAIFDTSAIHDGSQSQDQSNLCEMTYLRAAFGQPGCLGDTPYQPGAPWPKESKGYMTVFDPSGFGKLWSEIKAKYDAGEPAVVRSKHMVVDNANFGIVGGFEAEVVWVIGLPSKTWEASLPERTRAMLPIYFPNFASKDLRSRFEMSAVSQLGSWMTEKLALKEIRAMLDGDSPPSESPQPPTHITDTAPAPTIVL